MCTMRKWSPTWKVRPGALLPIAASIGMNAVYLFIRLSGRFPLRVQYKCGSQSTKTPSDVGGILSAVLVAAFRRDRGLSPAFSLLKRSGIEGPRPASSLSRWRRWFRGSARDRRHRGLSLPNADAGLHQRVVHERRRQRDRIPGHGRRGIPTSSSGAARAGHQLEPLRLLACRASPDLAAARLPKIHVA